MSKPRPIRFSAIGKGPSWTRFAGVEVRVVALELLSQPGIIKLTVQALNEEGLPIAEHPLLTQWMNRSEYLEFRKNSEDWGLPELKTGRQPQCKGNREYHAQKLREHRERKRKTKLDEARRSGGATISAGGV